LDWIGSVDTKGTENQSNPFKIAGFFFPILGGFGFWFFRLVTAVCIGLDWTWTPLGVTI